MRCVIYLEMLRKSPVAAVRLGSVCALENRNATYQQAVGEMSGYCHYFSAYVSIDFSVTNLNL